MELTPAERVKLNAAILNSVKTGQPLSADLQSLYNQAAQNQTNKTAGQVIGLLNPGFPTRNVSDVIVEPGGEGPFNLKRDYVKHSGPASSLPETRFEELYPRRVPVLNLEDSSYAPAASPFGKEFDFKQPSGQMLRCKVFEFDSVPEWHAQGQLGHVKMTTQRGAYRVGILKANGAVMLCK